MNKKEAGKAKAIFGIALLILILDQTVKLLIVNSLERTMEIIPGFLYFTFIANTGAGFGILKGQNSLLIFITLIILGLILFYYDRYPKNKLVHYGTSLIIGGALGNLVDRIRVGYVIDFISFSFWPAFNIADSAISIGALLLIIYFWRSS